MTNKYKLLIVGILLLASLLRLWKIDEVPVSLFGDELDVGYHAYSILKTGKDYSGNFMPLHFQSLAEWRTPLYLYSAVPTVALFGISPLGVRLPAALFGILGVWVFYLLLKLITGNWKLATVAALLLAISPWHIQYSRAGFEVTQMLALFLAGILFFLKGLKNGKWLVVSAVCFGFTPWAYSTAKLFTPLTLLALVVIWRKELFTVGKKWLFWSAVALVIVGSPISHSTIFGGGAARFGYISVFTDPTTVPEIGFARLRDAQMRDPQVEFGIQPTFIDRLLHNKLLSWASILGRNYLQSFSTQFLFINGDLNLRHSPPDIGQFYRAELLFLLLGGIFFFVKPMDKKIKTFLLFWILASPIPAALTRDGGMHATRLFFLLPPLIIFVSLGVFHLIEIVKGSYKKLILWGVVGMNVVSFIFYQHNFWVHYPWNSERWWHAGFGEAINFVKEIENDYDKVIISTANEPPWIFLLGWYQYPPDKWQKAQPLPKTDLKGFGEISYLDKFYFGTAESPSGIYSLAQLLDERTVYMASAKEFNLNFIQEPERLPKNLRMLKAVSYPSGEPVFYFLTFNPQNL